MKLDDNFGLIFFALCLMYFSTVCLALVRTFRLHRFAAEWRQAQFFYISLLLHTAMRTVFFACIINSVTSYTSMEFFLLLSIPDTSFIVSYLFLTWQFMSVFYYSHIESAMQESLLAQVNKKPQQSAATRFGVFFLIIWIGMQTSLFFALLVNYLKMLEISNELGIANLLIPTLVLGLMFYLQMKFSGSPTRSDEWSNRLRKVSVVTLIWSICRYFRGIVALLPGYSTASIAQDIGDGNSTISFAAVLLLVCQMIFSEILCLFLVFDYSFMTIFVYKPSHSDSESTVTASRKLSDEPKANKFSYISITRNLKEEDLKIGEALKAKQSGKQSGFGELFKTTYKKHQVVLRKVSFSRLSGYVLEEISEEFERLVGLDIEHLLPLVGVFIQSPVLGVVHPLMENGSLYDALHVDKADLNYNDRLQIARQIAQCMEELHQLGVYHGHLTSHNVLMDEELNAYVGDVGLHKAKKYAGLMFGYSNKTPWSSPEQLNERSLTATRISPSDDVYSFGLVLWELMAGQPPFADLNKRQLVQKVTKDEVRPQMPVGLPGPLVELIKLCWSASPETRPSFADIVRSLSPTDFGPVN
jgi:serine/threonine protein kinase